MMAAGFQRNIHGCALRRFRAGLQSLPLRMELSIARMVSLSNDTAMLYKDCPYHGVGVRPAASPLRQFQGQAHIILIFHLSPPKKRKMP